MSVQVKVLLAIMLAMIMEELSRQQYFGYN